MKKKECGKLFKKLDLQVRSTGHNCGWLIVNGKKVLRVHYSHGRGDIPDMVVNKIRGQLKLSKLSQGGFKELLKCTLTYKSYINLLKRKGFIE